MSAEQAKDDGGSCGLCSQPKKDAPACDLDNRPDIFPSVKTGEEDIPDDSELLTHDPTLMAFTQLGAFRTNCQRSFISLMDDKKQYIVAEVRHTVQTLADFLIVYQGYKKRIFE
jgi:hypothetical protein